MDAANAVTKQPNPAYRVWRDVPAEVRQERLQSVLHRIVNDERLADIAKDLNISRSALNMALLEYAEDDWKRAQVARALTRLDKAKSIREQMMLEPEHKEYVAPDVASLTLARDEEKSAQWELERLLRRLYGQDAPQTASQVVIMLGTDLRAAQQTHDIHTEAAQVIDVEHNAADSESVARSTHGSVDGVGGVGK